MLTRLCLAAVLALGCDSTALSLDDPNRVNVTFDPPYMPEEVSELEVVMQFTDADTEDDTGTGMDRGVLDVDTGGDDALVVESHTFETNFRLRLRLRRYAGAVDGEHTLSMEIYNRYGTFHAQGVFYVFLPDTTDAGAK